MKTGVSTTECGRVISATLALVVEHLASTRNAKAEPSPAPIMMLKLKSLSRIVCGSHSHQYSGFGFCSPILPISDQFQDQDEPENWAMARYFPAQLCLQLQQKICENWINNRTELSSMFQSTGCCFTESSISSGWIFFGIRLLTWWHCLQFQRNWSIIDQLHLVANVRGEPHKAPTCIMAPNTPVWILSSL